MPVLASPVYRPQFDKAPASRKADPAARRHSAGYNHGSEARAKSEHRTDPCIRAARASQSCFCLGRSQTRRANSEACSNLGSTLTRQAHAVGDCVHMRSCCVFLWVLVAAWLRHRQLCCVHPHVVLRCNLRLKMPDAGRCCTIHPAAGAGAHRQYHPVIQLRLNYGRCFPSTSRAIAAWRLPSASTTTFGFVAPPIFTHWFPVLPH